MEIRKAHESDIPAIVGLLKSSLGETLMPKSEAFWRWKHLDNPFGVSPVLVAVADGKLAGVRAFMKWEWQSNDRKFQAVRAVDTATHPSFQGKGIFRKLTLSLVDDCKQQGIDFVFNTPNKSSKPGYLKMGWYSAGRMRIGMRMVLGRGRRLETFDQAYRARIPENVSLSRMDKSVIQTLASREFLEWRYIKNPNVKYYSFHDESGGYDVYFRLKPHRFGTEFRITDTLLKDRSAMPLMQKHLRKVVGDSAANIITFASPSDLFSLTSLSLKVGPEVTLRSLAMRADLLSFNNWSPSLGDMEVF